ncbi:hypothetical protein COB55_01590 [Candidatus Wolfebacteria bacterium]|nr:MAG: hypothetical protein COB55_01590 [Candidatus Wolfebacteria bacterium]
MKEKTTFWKLLDEDKIAVGSIVRLTIGTVENIAKIVQLDDVFLVKLQTLTHKTIKCGKATPLQLEVITKTSNKKV